MISGSGLDACREILRWFLASVWSGYILIKAVTLICSCVHVFYWKITCLYGRHTPLQEMKTWFLRSYRKCGCVCVCASGLIWESRSKSTAQTHQGQGQESRCFITDFQTAAVERVHENGLPQRCTLYEYCSVLVSCPAGTEEARRWPSQQPSLSAAGL